MRQKRGEIFECDYEIYYVKSAYTQEKNARHIFFENSLGFQSPVIKIVMIALLLVSSMLQNWYIFLSIVVQSVELIQN